MDASRLAAVLADVETETGGLVPLLTKLSQAYTVARDTPAQDASDAIRQAHQEVRTFLETSATNIYSPSRRKILQTIGGEPFLGDTAASHIETLLAEASMGPAPVVVALQTYTTQLTQFRTSCTQVRRGLSALNIEPDALVGDQAEVGILVPRSLTGGHLGALNHQLRQWNNILRGLTELAGVDEREVTIRTLATGSEQIFVLTTVGVAVAFIIPIIDRVLEWYKKILEIRKLRLELEARGVPRQDAEHVKAFEKKIVDDGIDDVLKELMARAAPALTATRKSELRVQVTKSIQYIARFVDQGGDVEVTVAPPPEEEYVPTTEVAALPAAEADGLKAEWTAVRERQSQEHRELARKGAALAGLENRETGILPLPEAEVPPPPTDPTPDGEGDQKDDKRKKK